MIQSSLVSNLSKRYKSAVFIASLGTISHDVKTSGHQKFHCIPGSMGCAMGVGLGYALASSEKVVVLIGDGSFLMKQGSLSTILRHKPKNLKVIILNNNCYKSCGGQGTNFRFIKKYIPKNVKVYEVD